MRALPAFAIALLFAAIPLTEATASEEVETLIAGSSWEVQLSKLGSSHDVVKGGKVVELPIVPNRLYRAKGAARDLADQKTVLTAGQQLIPHKLFNGSWDYCTTSDLGFMNHGIFHCFVDQDADGKIDGYYRVLSRLLSGAPIVDSGKTGGYRPIEPVLLESIETDAIDSPLKLVVKWTKGDGISEDMLFEVALVSQTAKDLHFEQKFALRRNPGARAIVMGLLLQCASRGKNAATCKVQPVADHLFMHTMGTKVRFSENVDA